MKTNAMKKLYLGVAMTASLGMLGSAVSAAPMVTYLGEDCKFAPCVDLASGGYTVDGGAVVNPAEDISGFAKTPGTDTGNQGDVLSYNVTSSANDPDGASSNVVVTNLDSAFELYWGSIDTYNYIDFYLDGERFHIFSGDDAVATANSQGANIAPSTRNYDTDGYFSFLGEGDYLFDQVILRSENYGGNAIAFEFATAVPEPGTMALLGLGLAGLGAARRRKLAE